MFNKFSIISLSLISTLISYSQAIIITEVTSIEKDIVYLKSDSSLFNGLTKEFYPNNSIKLAAHYKEGYKHGKFKRWHKVFWDNFETSVKLHNIKKLIVINHRDCGAAKIINGKKDFTNINETNVHKNSFQKIKKIFKKKYPKLSIELKIISLNSNVETFK